MNTPVIVFVAESIAGSNNIINEFKYFILISFPLAILLIGAVSIWITKKSLMPLNNFSGEVSRVTHKNLDTRIDIDSTALELKELTFSFNDMLDRLKKAFDLERFIISESSHKLKTPVAIIKSYCEITLQKERDRAEYTETLQTIKTVADDMTNLIKGILSLAHLDSANMNFNNFREIWLNDCINDAVQLSEYLLKHKNIDLKLNLPEKILITGDKDKITEAFFNIIDNAIKYNREGGYIKITSNRENNLIKISVQDNGIGINQEDLEQIFERFFRSEPAKNLEGSGLGLNIVKTIIEAHNGQIEVKSHPGQGSEFIVSLPFPF